jgi:magnesium chelatase family protein
MLARRLSIILPAMSLVEALETTRLHRVSGLTGARTALVTTRPRRALHQTISAVGLIDGGHLPMLGEGSLAHHGMRFLDARPEFEGMSSMACINPLRRVSYTYTLAGILNLNAIAALAARVVTSRGSGSSR